MPLMLWISEGSVLACLVNLGLIFLGYVRSVRLLRQAEADPRLTPMLPRIERNVYIQRGALAFIAMALLIVVRLHLANLGVFPFALPAE